MGLIYIPRPMVDEIVENSKREGAAKLWEETLCVKIPYRGYEISISTDSRGGDDFTSGGIRVYKDNKDVTAMFADLPFYGAPGAEGTGEMLRQIMGEIDKTFPHWEVA